MSFSKPESHFSGGCHETIKAADETDLLLAIKESLPTFDFDIVVIGGGSGGLAAAKEAARLGKKVSRDHT